MKVGLVSIYPPLGSKHEKHGGVSSYAKNLATSLASNCEVIVFGNKIPQKGLDRYYEGALIYRCWDKGPSYPFQVFKRLVAEGTDVVHIQHEIYLFGGLISNIAFPLLLLLIRILGKPVLVTLHGVVPVSTIDRRFLIGNWTNGVPWVMKFGLIILMRMILFLSTTVIVHEDAFKEVLTSEYNLSAEKVQVVHHGIEKRTDSIEKYAAKHKLGFGRKKVLLFFGYITGYKNIELLIESARFLTTEDWIMLIAGGPHPRLLNDHDYRLYLLQLQDRAMSISEDRILFRGFVHEADVPLYFSAADLLVFPYNAALSYSGPVCLAISYKRPFLITNFYEQMIGCEELLFNSDPQELASKIDMLLQNQGLRRRVLRYIDRMGAERSWSNIAGETLDLYKRCVS